MVSSPKTSPSQDSPPSSSSNSTSSSSSNSTSPSSSSPSPPPPESSPSPPPPPKRSSSSSSPPPSPPISSSPPPPPPKSSSPPPKQSSPPPPASTSKNNTNSPHFQPPPPPSSSSHHHPPPPLPPPHVKNVSNHSPPPPTKSGGSSSKSHNSPSKSEPNDDPNVSIVAGVAVAVGVVLFIFVVILVVCCRKKKRTRYPQMQYYSEPKAGGDDPYYTGLLHRPWGEHGAKATPPPQGGLVSSGAWGTPSTVPPPGAGGAWGTPSTVPPPGAGGAWGTSSTVPPPGAGGAWGTSSTVPPPGAGGGWVSAPSPVPAPIMSGDLSSLSSGAQHTPLPPPTPNIVPHGINTGTFTYEELSAATGGFSEANLLGQGGFGFVHKGVLPSGKEIAVKSLKSGSGQGEREFQAEVEIISRIHHRYLVSLVGYCMARQQRMLVYEFLPNNTLEYHLHGKDRPVMDFSTRIRIALGSAKGLAYIHEDCHPRIIHRDIKSANILLDNNFEAKVADFGLAKLSSDNYTHVSTRVMGTFGYLAPEYASSGKLTDKSDVYSFGVVLLELITGKQPVDPTNSMEDSLVDWARPHLARALEDGNLGPLVDPRLENNYNHEEMKRMVACAAASIRHSARKRPRMSQIVRTLEGNSSLDDLEDGVKTGQSSVYSYGGAAPDYSRSSYDAD
ncbi:hypothetical protein HRI_004545400 [Hibiscus trionum]|uniref:non-specific serine/threonine protein kinase n=1 Tax=Hibiscus trionum TaxID=183268 RepID=A0A9W7J8U6_HIBTR|nr:hypothetical protein HRI_004545400 [Hibiscus trionum]